MNAKELINDYMAQTSTFYACAEHDAHTNGSTHVNSSGSHADSGQIGGGGHGDYNDSNANY